MMVVGLAIMANGQDINTNTYNIEITTNDDYISVVESLKVDIGSSENISFWIQGYRADLVVLIDGSNVDYEQTLPIEDHTYLCNISGLDITTDTTIQLTYTLDGGTNEFEKTLKYNTTSITISFDGTDIYTGNSLKSGSSLNVALQKPITTVITETKTEYKVPDWYYLIIIALIILVLLSFVFPSKKQKTTKKKEATTGSEELLDTKKTLLMSLLKDIEKQHRAKQISDDTYHKLKEQYKQEAVDAMKKLEDMKSKVK